MKCECDWSGPCESCEMADLKTKAARYGFILVSKDNLSEAQVKALNEYANQLKTNPNNDEEL